MNVRSLSALFACTLMSLVFAAALPNAASANDRVVNETVRSSTNGRFYPIEIFIPAAYDAGREAFASIYALDGDANFGPQRRFENLKNVLVRRGAKAILIGIGNTVHRQEDYNFPGAEAYHAFLEKDLIPFIESKYRMDPRKRMITGLSTSGNLAMTALFLEQPDKPLFSYFISIEAAFWQQSGQNFNLEQKMFDALAGRPLPVTVILAYCVGACNMTYVQTMYQRMQGRHYPGLQLIETSFSTSHSGTDVPAFDDAMARILPVLDSQPDTRPDTFAFAPRISSVTNAIVISDRITVTGIHTGSPISVAGGSYSINGSAFTASPGTVQNGDTVTVRLTAPATLKARGCATLNIGGVVSDFCATATISAGELMNAILMFLDD
jgi:hypothetical protein